MENQEIKTITAAMVTKQTWVRKSLDDFLEIWAEITKDAISGHKEMTLYEFSEDEDTTEKMYLQRNDADVYGATKNPYTGIWEEWEKSYGYNEYSSIASVRRMILAISENLPKYFKNIQADIDNLSEAGERVNTLIEKLK